MAARPPREAVDPSRLPIPSLLHKPKASRRWRMWGITIAAVCAAAAAAATIVIAPSFRVASIVPEGGSESLRADALRLASAYVREHASVLGSPRLVLVSRDKLGDFLRSAIPQLATVRVVRSLPGTITLTLQEKIPVVFLRAGARLFSVTGEGEVLNELASADQGPEGVPVIRLREDRVFRPGEYALNARVLQALHQVVIRLPETLSLSSEELSVPSANSEELYVRTSAGWTLLLDTARSLDDQFAVFEKVISETLKPADLASLAYVDLRIPGKVFYAFKNGAAARTFP